MEENRVICPICGDTMRLSMFNETAIWICEGGGCPAILFEYIDKSNIIDIQGYFAQ